MALRFAILAALLAAVNAGAPGVLTYGAPSVAVAAPAITSQYANTLRSYGNLGQVSTYQKTIDTPYSSVRKYDTRVSNDALAYGGYHAPLGAYHAPVAAYHAPALRAYGAPYAYGASAVKAAPAGLLGVAYSAAPAVATMSFTGYGINYAY